MTDSRQQQSLCLRRDSVCIHDSVSVSYRPAASSLLPGDGAGARPMDTVCVERWHTRWREKIVIQTDTLWREQTRNETVRVPYVPLFYKCCTGFFILLVLVGIILFIYRLKR